MKGKFPFNSFWQSLLKDMLMKSTGDMPDMSKLANFDLSWLGDYIQDEVGKKSPQFGSEFGSEVKSSSIKHDIFETHDFIIVRINVPPNINPHRLRVFLDTNQLLVKGFPDKNHTIPLPANGTLIGSEAIFKDNVLEVKVLKDMNRKYDEIDIMFY